MKCAICGIEMDSVEDRIDHRWIPYAGDGDKEKDGPFCPSCSDTLRETGEDGEFVVKEQYSGKIAHLECNFDEDEQDENMPDQRQVFFPVVDE